VVVVRLGNGRRSRRESKAESKLAREVRRKRDRVLRLLNDPKWSDRSTNWIAMMAGVSWLFADKVRIEFDGDAAPRKRESRSGQMCDPYAERK
jgi:hypothetical protein